MVWTSKSWEKNIIKKNVYLYIICIKFNIIN